MGSPSTFGARRNEAQLRALVGVQREVRATDGSGRQKYLRDFSGAFRTYEAVLASEEFTSVVHAADVILVGDYHALPASQRFAASLLEDRAQPGDRPVVLGLETVFSRHQHVLDAWWRREIEESELRERTRFDVDWGYSWAPFYDLLVTAREHGDAIYGLDCMPRDDLRKITARDRHAVDKISEVRARHPGAVIIVLFGESHFAPSHLPRLLSEKLPAERVLTVLQNVDALYWNATSETRDRVDAVRVNSDVVCVFNSTPLEKYESYRLYLSRCIGDSGQPDLVPTIYNLIDSLLSFLDINRYSSHNGTQPRFLVDLLPEVLGASSESRLRQLLLRAEADPSRIENILQRVESRGSTYLPAINTFYIQDFQMMYAAEETARFLHHACRGLPLRRTGRTVPSVERPDRFYARTVEHALAFFGSQVLFPARPEAELACTMFSRKVLTRFEQDAIRGDRAQFDQFAQQLGYGLGNQLYNAYLRGSVNRYALRRLFLASLEQPGEARRVCEGILQKFRRNRKKPCASVSVQREAKHPRSL